MIQIPTITQLYNAIKADLTTAFGTTIPSFGKNFLRASAMAQAGKLKLYYLVIASLQKNIFIDTAEPEVSGGTLERFGRVKLNRDPFPAVPGQYTITITGTIGATILSSTRFKSDDDSSNPGLLYILDNTFILESSPDTIVLRALTSGLEGKLQVGDTLTSTIPIANVNAGATVAAETVEPRAAEDIEVYRSKGLDAYRLEPQGGAASDYRLWALDAQGVKQVYPYATSGESAEIDLYVEATIADSTDGKGTPSAGLLSAVEAVIELDPDTTRPLNERGRRPLGVFQVNYLPIVPKEIAIQIASFSGITGAIQTLIFTAIEEYLAGVRPFVAGADVVANRRDTFSVNDIISIILTNRPGSSFGTVTMTVDGVPTTSFQFLFGNLPSLDTITYP